MGCSMQDGYPGIATPGIILGVVMYMYVFCLTKCANLPEWQPEKSTSVGRHDRK